MSKKQKVLVTGAAGLVGSRFVEMSKDYDLIIPKRNDFDLTDIDSVYKTVIEANPDWLINFAAFTDVDAAEKQPHDETSMAWQTNVKGVENLSNAFLSDHLIQISTNMVFPGTLDNPGPYAEYDKAASNKDRLTWYGWTKAQGEKIIFKHGGSILRLIYPVRAKFSQKLDFLHSNLKQYSAGHLKPLFTDQQISVTYIDEAIDTINKIITREAHGIYHASTDTTTPYELISYTLEQLGENARLPQTTLAEYLTSHPSSHRYALFDGLKTVNTEAELEIHFSTWQTMVEKLIAQGLSLK